MAGVGDAASGSSASSDYGSTGAPSKAQQIMYKVKRFVRKSKDVVDFVSYAVFLLLFTFVALNANPGEDLIEQNRAVRTAITEQEFFFNTSHVRKDFYDIDGVDEFWKWMRGAPPLHPLSS